MGPANSAEELRKECVIDSKCFQHGLLPIVPTLYRSPRVYGAQGQDTFDRSGDKSQIQSASVVLLPGRQVKCTKTGECRQDCRPGITKIDRAGKDDDAEGGVDGIDTVIKELTKRSGLLSPPGLSSVASIKGLVEKQADGPGCVDPGRTIRVEGRVIPEQREEVDDDERETGESNQVRSTAYYC